ncbi:hypothetical protein ALON55S_02638 [Alishewanella longhuensis]
MLKTFFVTLTLLLFSWQLSATDSLLVTKQAFEIARVSHAKWPGDQPGAGRLGSLWHP